MVLALRPGANLIQTTATDSSGNVSATNSLVMRYVNPQTNANLIAVSEHLLGSLITDNSGKFIQEEAVHDLPLSESIEHHTSHGSHESHEQPHPAH